MFRTRPCLRFSATRIRSQRHTSSVSALYPAFKDPPPSFRLLHRTLGPGASNAPPIRANLTTLAREPPTVNEALEEAKEALLQRGLDSQSFWEQRIVWGDQDPFQRPVTFPDTLLIGYRPVPPASDHTDLATFHAAASAYSLLQKAFIAHTKEALVWYDYDTLKKCHPGERALEVLWGRVRKE
ncbi:unnamed protein product [Cyclocybe aegerita]|uniref:Uncharacterized protein n=1 Tax=Cyclocybe aegerita TaxID=1973307 RepID=A0A8S0W4H3_CYCAE|nr:unnamed protein product [Cyclocybe aegerita]